MKVTIFGAGAFGTALGKILEENGHTVKYYDPVKFPETNLSDVINGSEVNIIAAPSNAITKLLFFIPKDRPLICASKGLLSFAPFTSYGENFSVISGGAFAKDLAAHKPTTLTATSELAKQLFQNSWLTFDTTTDHHGVLLCGTLKNVYAIGSGLWQLKYGTPDFDDYINRSLGEIQKFLMINECDPATAGLACGVQDLLLTASSAESRNYAFGNKLRTIPRLGADVIAGRARINSTVEGLNTIQAIDHTPSFKRPDSNIPLFDIIYSAVTGKPIEAVPIPKVPETKAPAAKPAAKKDNKKAPAPAAPAAPEKPEAQPAPAAAPAPSEPTPAQPAQQ